jgi:hypothetical protein
MIFVFCMRSRKSEIKGKAYFEFKDKHGSIDTGKVVRFYAAEKGGVVKKIYEDQSITYFMSETPHHLFMQYHEDRPPVNYAFYIKKARDLISMEKPQLTLF